MNSYFALGVCLLFTFLEVCCSNGDSEHSIIVHFEQHKSFCKTADFPGCTWRYENINCTAPGTSNAECSKHQAVKAMDDKGFTQFVSKYVPIDAAKMVDLNCSENQQHVSILSIDYMSPYEPDVFCKGLLWNNEPEYKATCGTISNYDECVSVPCSSNNNLTDVCRYDNKDDLNRMKLSMQAMCQQSSTAGGCRVFLPRMYLDRYQDPSCFTHKHTLSKVASGCHPQFGTICYAKWGQIKYSCKEEKIETTIITPMITPTSTPTITPATTRMTTSATTPVSNAIVTAIPPINPQKQDALSSNVIIGVTLTLMLMAVALGTLVAKKYYCKRQDQSDNSPDSIPEGQLNRATYNEGKADSKDNEGRVNPKDRSVSATDLDLQFQRAN